MCHKLLIINSLWHTTYIEHGAESAGASVNQIVYNQIFNMNLQTFYFAMKSESYKNDAELAEKLYDFGNKVISTALCGMSSIGMPMQKFTQMVGMHFVNNGFKNIEQV